MKCEFQQAPVLSVPLFPIFKRNNNSFASRDVKRIKLCEMGPETQDVLNKCGQFVIIIIIITIISNSIVFWWLFKKLSGVDITSLSSTFHMLKLRLII